MTADGTVYYANGTGHACSYSFTGGLPLTGLPMYPAFPSDIVVNDGVCGANYYHNVLGYSGQGNGSTDDMFNCALGNHPLGGSCTLSPTTTLYIPPGTYTFSHGIVVPAGVAITSDGATLTMNAAASGNAILALSANDSVQRLNFQTTGVQGAYGVMVFGSNSQVSNNYFFGNGAGETVALQVYPTTGVVVSGNTFDGSIGLSSSAYTGLAVPMRLLGAENFQVKNNTFYDTAGFGIEAEYGTQSGTMNGNCFNAPTRIESATSNGGLQYSFHFPVTVIASTVALQLNGRPLLTNYGNPPSGVTPDATVTADSSQMNYTVTFTRNPPSGETIQLQGWRALEQLQANSQTTNITFNSNTVVGSGDSCIDVVSDFDFTSLASCTLASGTTYTCNAPGAPGLPPNSPVVPVINNLQVAGNATVSPPAAQSVATTYKVVLGSPLPSGQTLNLYYVLNVTNAKQFDYPSNITITNNSVSGCHSSGIANEVNAWWVNISNNTVTNTSLGVAPDILPNNQAYSSGIFIAGGDATVSGNSIVEQGPTALYGITFLSSAYPSRITSSPATVNTFSGVLDENVFPGQ
jgi:hypothetical protein